MRQETAVIIGPPPDKLIFNKDEEHPDCMKLKEVLREQISTLYNQGVKNFMSSLEWGVPLIGAGIVNELREQYEDMHLISIISYQYQDSYWPEKYREAYKKAVIKSSLIHQIGTSYYKECEKDRDRYLAENSAILLAVFPKGKSPIHSGHTARTICYALERGGQVIGIDPNTWEVYTQDDIPQLEKYRPKQSRHRRIGERAS